MTSPDLPEPVRPGIYVSVRHLDVRLVEPGDGPFEGKPGARYRRLPPRAVLVLAPMLAGAFAMAFPALIFAALGTALVRRIVSPPARGRRTFDAGQPVRAGAYVAVNRLGARYVGADGEPLGGRAGTRYLRIPTPLLLLASPFIGAAYVLAFPLFLAAALLGGLLHALFGAGHTGERNEP